MTRLHFDLNHLTDDSTLRVSIGGRELPLLTHGDKSLNLSAGSNQMLSALGNAARRFSHFADLTELNLPRDATSLVRIVRAAPAGVHLAQTIAMMHHIPEGALRGFFRSQFRRYRRPLRQIRAFIHAAGTEVRPRLYTGMLPVLGINDLPTDDDEALRLLLAAAELCTVMETAASLVIQHPNLSSIDPYTSAVVKHDHILPDPKKDPAQYNAMQLLAQAIHDVGDDWSPVVPCRDKDGNPLTAGYEIPGAFSKGQQLFTYDLHDTVANAMPGPICGANRTASNDVRLSGKTWSPTRGKTSVEEVGEKPAPTQAAGPSYKWTANEQTNHYGVSVSKCSIAIDGANNFSISAGNSYLRTLFVGYQLKDDAGQSIGGLNTLYSIGASNNIMGISMPTDPTALEFNLGSAAQVELLFGSLGVSDWVNEVSDKGALLTGLWQYGIPTVFLLAGKVLTSTETFNKIVNDKELTLTAIALGIPIVGGGAATAAAVTNFKQVIFSMAHTALSLVLQKGMEKLGGWLAQQVAAGAISSAFGPVGWVFKAAAATLSFTRMAVTTNDVLSSPATVRVTVGRAIDVALTLHPDPAHGEAGNDATAVWPTVATRYQATLLYKKGTSFVQKGPMPTTTTFNTPLPLRFTDVPAGGQFQITICLYSSNGWLAGSWQSDWIAAVPNSGTTLDLGKRHITEVLVPLAPDTQYVYKEDMAYDRAKGFQWQVGKPATATVAALDCGNNGSLCELVGVTINNSTFQVGYAWRASGQSLHPDTAKAAVSNNQLYAVQSLSVLANPQSRLTTTGIGFTSRPQIAYAPAFTRTNEVDQHNFVLDPRGGGMHLRKVTLRTTDGQSDFGLGDAGQLSWGRFPIQNIDALAIHPSNLAVAASFQTHKMMILPLPAQGATDDTAPEALMVSGEGIREGLMRGPKALAITPDGRILVLESDNIRVQAFDTKGNAVPSFTWLPALFELNSADIAAQLDGGGLPASFLDALVDSGATYRFDINGDFAAELDTQTFSPSHDPLIQALAYNGVTLSYDPEHMADPALSAQITVLVKGQAWTVTDPRGYAYRLVLNDGAISVHDLPNRTVIQVQTRGERWLLTDTLLGSSWQLSPSSADAGKTLVQISMSYFPLKNLPRSATFLDMVVEAGGHIYVLMYSGDGSAVTDYILDIYTPSGILLSRTPDPSATRTPQNLVAGKMAVDLFRNLYALGFGVTKGPGGAIQPSLSHWAPTTPLFSLDKSLQQALNDRNITVVQQAFAAKQVILTSQAYIEVVDREGTWHIKDGSTSYHLYRTGDQIQVYPVPA